MTSAYQAQPRATFFGCVLVGLWLTVVWGALTPFDTKVSATVCAWCAALALWSATSPKVRLQIAVLMGVAFVGFALTPSPREMSAFLDLVGNGVPLAAMLVAVSALQLLGDQLNLAGTRPRGAPALFRTFGGVTLFGAALNLSALVVAGDSIRRSGALTQFQSSALTQAFCTAVFFSPLIGGMALALTIIPDLEFLEVAIPGLALALLTWPAAVRLSTLRSAAEVDAFEGFPWRRDALKLPLVLALSIFAAATMMPERSMLTLLSVTTPAVVVAMLLWHQGLGATRSRLTEHVRSRLPAMAGEIWLFLAAGFMAASLTLAVQSDAAMIALDSFGPFEACIAMTITLVLSWLGLHPVVPMSAMVAISTPASTPPDLLAFTFVCSWGMGCVANPLAAQVLTMQARYQMNAHELARSNRPFSLLLLALSSVMVFVWPSF